MSPGRTVTRLLVLILLVGACSISGNMTAEAGWGYHRFHYGFYGYRPYYRPHFHHRYYYSAWPVYRSYYYRPVYPVYYRTYYAPSYYVSPVYHGCGYSSWGYWSSNTTGTAPLAAYAKTVTPAKAAAPGTDTVLALKHAPAVSTGTIELNVSVPEDARVTINDRPTKTTGSERTYVTRDVPMDGRYEFVIRAEYMRDGRVETETKRVALQGGDSSSVAFGLTDPASQIVSNEISEPVSTTLSIRVPDDSEVYLEGYQMKQTGDLRVFQTKKLGPGEELADYTVRVVSSLNGKTATLEKQVTLVGGQSQEIEFDFGHLEERLVSSR